MTATKDAPFVPDAIQTHAQAGRASLALPLASVVAGYAVVILFAAQVLNDGDTYWHIAAGDWMLRNVAVPRTDPFSSSFAGAPWVAHEWLSEVLMALGYRAGGWTGEVMLFAAAFALTLGLLATHLQRWVGGLPASLLLLLGAACVGPDLLARPHVLALPVLEAWTAGLLLARARDVGPSPLLLPLMALWANLHGSFVVGLVLTAPFALEAMLEGGPTAARRWGLFILGSLLAAMVTPHGFNGLLFPFRLMGMAHLAEIDEWKPLDFGTFQPIEGALAALLYVAFTRGIRVPPLRALLLLGLLHEALRHSRHQMVAGIIGALVLAEPLGHPLARSQTPPRLRWPGPAWSAAALAVAIALTSFRVAVPVVRHDDRMTPMAALDHVPPALAATPVFNDYAFGGYLIFKGVRPIIDSRADMYGDDFLSAYAAATGPAPGPFQTMADRYGVRWTLLNPASPLLATLDSSPDWRRLFADRTAVVHVRTDAAP